MTRKTLQFLTVVAVLLAATYGMVTYLTRALGQHQLAVCRSENRIVAQLNLHATDQARVMRIIEHFAHDASLARMATYDAIHRRSDLIAAREYNDQYHDLLRIPLAHYVQLNCPRYA